MKKVEKAIWVLIQAAHNLDCQDLHHKHSERHNAGEDCKAKEQLDNAIEVVIEHLKGS
jgi:hypothetical protein